MLAWNDPQAVDTAFDRHGSEIAGILTEPAMLNSGAIPPRAEYLEHLRAVADAHGSLLIFDEVITGFRLALGGGAERFGVAPDLAAYGKAIAAGYPVAAFAGRADVMERLAAGVNHAGTFNGNRMGAAAVLATLSRLRDSTVYEQVAAHGAELMAALPRIAGECGRDLNVHGFPMAFHVSFGHAEVTDWRSLQQLGLAEYVRFASHLVDNGLWVTDRGVWYVSVAHGPRELTETQERFEEALRAWSQTEDHSRSASLADRGTGKVKEFRPEDLKFLYSSDHDPIGSVAPGERFIVETEDCFTGRYRNPSGFTPENNAWIDRNLDGVTGPIYVDRAEPDDIVAVTIHDIEVTTRGSVALESMLGAVPI